MLSARKNKLNQFTVLYTLGVLNVINLLKILV